MSKILVTGSKGVVGSKLVEMLTERGHIVRGLDLMHAPGEVGWQHKLATAPGTYDRCDISDFRQLQRIISHGNFDYVYNCAAEFGRWNGEDFYEQLWRTNAIGTKNIIRLQEQYGFNLIHFSSSEVYGDFDGLMDEHVPDAFPIRQMNDYAMSKWVNEMQIKNSAIQYGTNSVIVRLFNTYGPGEKYTPYRSVNAKFCYHALHGLPITVYRGHYRTSTYLDDTCRTLCNIVDNFIPGEVYNIGGSQSHSIEELAQTIWQYTGADLALITYAGSEEMTTKVKNVDVMKAMHQLGHIDTVTLKQGVEKTINWMKEYYGK